MHRNNLHNQDYDFPKLCAEHPQLNEFVFTNKYNKLTINFAYPQAVKALNTALIKTHYNINYWLFSDENLCPPIPSRVDYIHHLNDLLIESKLENSTILDIGTGATCIYPLLGNSVYGWDFVATDIDKNTLNNAQKIINHNKLNKQITLRYQNNKVNILHNVIEKNDVFAASMCNPPFYSSEQDAIEANNRKLKGLGITSTTRNFSGISNELWYEGGEKAFLHNYIYQSSKFKNNCHWFTSLVSKKDNIKNLKNSLEKLNATDIKIIPMQQGNKITRILAWTYV